MPDEPDQPEGGEPQLQREALGDLGPGAGPVQYRSTWLPAPGSTWTASPYPVPPSPGGAGPWTAAGPGDVYQPPLVTPDQGHLGRPSTWLPAPTMVTALDGDGRPKPGRYVVESHSVTEFEVLENGHVVVHRTEHSGGAAQPKE